MVTDGAGCFAREYQNRGKWFESEYSDSSTTPQIGDIVTFVWNYSGRYYNQDKYYSDHVGIVYAVDDSYIYTIEGNAGADNDTSSVKLKATFFNLTYRIKIHSDMMKNCDILIKKYTTQS